LIDSYVPGVVSCHPRPWQLRGLDRCDQAVVGRCSTPVPGSSGWTRGSCHAVPPDPRHSATLGPGHGCNDRSVGLTSHTRDVPESPPYNIQHHDTTAAAAAAATTTALTSHTRVKVNSAFHPSGELKSSTMRLSCTVSEI